MRPWQITQGRVYAGKNENAAKRRVVSIRGETVCYEVKRRGMSRAVLYGASLLSFAHWAGEDVTEHGREADG